LVVLAIAVQFYTGDWYKCVKLARLLSDLEHRRRDDVCLLFVRTTECPVTHLLDDAIARCSEVFHVERVVLRPDTPGRRERWDKLDRWPTGCNVLWQGAVEYFLRMDPRWGSLFTVDGGDGVPLCQDWLDLLVEDHARTIRGGQLATGWVGRDGLGKWHANLNMVWDRQFFARHPEVLEMPGGDDLYEPVDMYRSGVILSECRASSIVRNDWRFLGSRPEILSRIVEHSAWWHGCRDGDLVDKARAFIFGGQRARPAPLDLGRAVDVVGYSGGSSEI
jgi:hypothetical protein